MSRIDPLEKQREVEFFKVQGLRVFFSLLLPSSLSFFRFNYD